MLPLFSVSALFVYGKPIRYAVGWAVDALSAIIAGMIVGSWGISLKHSENAA